MGIIEDAEALVKRSFAELTETEDQVAAEVRETAKAFHTAVSKLGLSRELSIAKTKIEEAVQWAESHIRNL